MPFPIERYLNVRQAYWPCFTADGQQLLFLANITDVPQVWRVPASPAGAEPAWPEQLAFGADRCQGIWAAPLPDDRRLIFARDTGGDENAQLLLLDPEQGVERSLTAGFEGAMHIFGAWAPDGQAILFAANRRHPGRFDLYLQPLDGAARMVWQNDEPGYLFYGTLSPDGRRAAVTRVPNGTAHDLFEVELGTATARRIAPGATPTRYEKLAYSADGRALYLLTDRDSDVMRVAQLDLESGALTPLVSAGWDATVLELAPDGRSLAYVVNQDGTSLLQIRDLETGQTAAVPLPDTAPGVAAYLDERLAFSPDSRRLAFSFTSATRTSDVYLWSRGAEKPWPLTRSAHGGLPLASFAAPTLIHYPTFDERTIPAWFYTPAIPAANPLPAVVIVHGGPEGQFVPYFHFLIQYVLQQGYAVLAPNVRGSTGYGKAYSHLDDVRLRMDSVADLAHAAHWLRAQPGVDGDRIAVYGGSYGGFMVLSALTTYPDLWAAGIDIVGISNFVTFLENTSEYRRAHRAAEYGSLEHDREFLESIAPINHLDQISAPLMVIHGENDPRVPVSEARQLVERLRERGVPVQLLIFDDEGHGLVKLKNKLVAYPAVVAFLDQHLGAPAAPDSPAS